MLGAKNVMVVGTGTIGEPLIGLLCTFRAQLGIDEVFFHKRTPLLTDRSKVANLLRRGARLVTDPDRVDQFEKLGLRVDYTTDEAMEAVRVVIDCTPMGFAMKDKLYSRYEDSTDLFIAQRTCAAAASSVCGAATTSARTPGSCPVPRPVITRTSASAPTMLVMPGTFSTPWATTYLCSARP